MNLLFLNQFTDEQLREIISRSCELLRERRLHRLSMEDFDKRLRPNLDVQIADFPPITQEERETTYNYKRGFAVVRGPEPHQFRFHFTPGIKQSPPIGHQECMDIAIVTLHLDREKVVGGGVFDLCGHDGRKANMYFDGFPPELLIPIVGQLMEQGELKELCIDCFGHQFWESPVWWDNLYQEACERVDITPLGRAALLDLLPFVPNYKKMIAEQFAALP